MRFTPLFDLATVIALPVNAPESVKPESARAAADYEVRVLGAPKTPLRDFYHALMRLSWPTTMLFLASIYFAVNALFAFFYFESGGIANARPGSFRDAFYFSVQTMGTIGYGVLAPVSDLANLLVVVESTVSLVLTALATGLVFATSRLDRRSASFPAEAG